MVKYYRDGFAMAYGYRGKILHVDLTDRRIEVAEKNSTFYRTYLVGRGIGYHYQLKEETRGN